MAYWLLKTEPSTYSFADLERDKQTRWDGIANPVAIRNLREAKAGDLALVYHTGGEKAAVGICEIVKPAYGEPPVVDVKAREKLGKPVTLATLKADPAFSESPLVRQGRLSFVPISEKQWARVLHLSR